MWLRYLRYRIQPATVVPVMSLEESRRTQRPYRYGMILLCIGALINWLGVAENYAEPVRYVGVACILAGALLICTAMCCWLHTPTRTGTDNGDSSDSPIHVISVPDEIRQEKPPDYDVVAVQPPSYDDAIKLNPAVLAFGVTAPGTVTTMRHATATTATMTTTTPPCTSAQHITCATVVVVTIPDVVKPFENPPPYSTAAFAVAPALPTTTATLTATTTTTTATAMVTTARR